MIDGEPSLLLTSAVISSPVGQNVHVELVFVMYFYGERWICSMLTQNKHTNSHTSMMQTD